MKLEKAKTTYLLPKSLARRIRQEAADTDRRPAHVVIEACEAYFKGRVRPRKADKLASAN